MPDKITIAGREVGTTGFGLMAFTGRPFIIPDAEIFASINTSLSHGANFFVSGEFYGLRDPEDNLHMLKRYFTTYPEAVDKVVLSVKAGMNWVTRTPDSSPAALRASIDNILEKTGRNRIDVFCIARVDKTIPLEESYKVVKEYIDTGKIGSFCPSECSAETIRKAVDILGKQNISCVELEVSLWAIEIFENGVAEVCEEFGIPIAAYSPLGRGFLTGRFKSADDLPEGDMRKHFDRFKPENFDKNLRLVEMVEGIAGRKGCTSSQLGLAWVRQVGGRWGRDGLKIIPIFGATKQAQVAENLQSVELTDSEMDEIDGILKSFKPTGGRYFGHLEGMLYQ
ncbi:Pyridoxine 4-dehydrogenase [Orbilia oligospora]|uniref:Pyridoxine 4-dehydrogenase n=1 Tax=Orbilia oligospora TaxID=2813651 RepID=A0A6G1MD30_ORBOL|nr:Pyridoxine 4-dehydrogenase [Orbilia oligospora]KAF3207535.1 Pyridoxine 4-dehydrogenase [Orbilia oligospora]KAF3207582.1 Pyridoxine 4-dehydrogenase [Orbilia oligospora]KAF3228961.1 Pyridoxine 4-dehydrogenase [Orbilia oligospora]KAF3252697.1 Pyridoxine 4-dehydrogenase [Orbilia oligospora]